MSILRNKAKSRGASPAAETGERESVIGDTRPAESGISRANTHRGITGDRVRALAFCQLSMAEIAAVLGCDAALIVPFAEICRQGREAGREALLNALTLNAVVHQNLRAQLFLHKAQIRSAALAAAEARKARERRFYTMTSEEREQEVVRIFERFGIDKMCPEEMKQIRAERGLPQANGKPKAD
jgi:hypothetical protein